MIITRTPFRISFFGGGTDYPVWYKKHGGKVLSTSIDKYCYLTCRFLSPFLDYNYRVSYAKLEQVRYLNQIDHPSVREVLKFVKLGKGVAISHDSDLPARSGLGSSSSFTVGLLNALYGLRGEITTKSQLALDAVHVEQKKIKENVGSQDQFAAAFGGFNKIEFGGVQEATVHPITIREKRLKLLQNHLMIFFTGLSRKASVVAGAQIKNTLKKETELREMMFMVDEAVDILNGNGNIDDFGELLNESWKIKRTLSAKITNSFIDEIYETGLKTGALGGKLLGAGAGGFMLFFIKPELQPQLKKKLKKFLHVPFSFDNSGSRVIYHSSHDNY